MSNTIQHDRKKNRKKVLLAWGSILGIIALITAAAFTDTEWADLGSGGIGTTETYNLTISVDGGSTWDDDTTAANAPVATLPGAESLVPGGSASTDPAIQVKNDGTADSSLALSLVQQDGQPTDATYLAALRFDVTQDEQAKVSNAAFEAVQDLQLDALEAGEVTEVEITVHLPSDEVDNDLAGKQAFLTAKFMGESQ